MADDHDATDPTTRLDDPDATLRVQLGEERAVVGKRIVEREAVRVHLRTVEEEVAYTETLRRDQVTVERQAVGRVVDAVPETRVEGDTTIVPVVEEVLVKRYRVIEEVRITSTVLTEDVTDTITLRRQEAIVDGNPDP